MANPDVFRITMEGQRAAAQTVRAIGDRAYARFVTNLEDVMADIFAETQVLVPVETGALKRSGRVVREAVTADGVVLSIAYGGPSEPRYVDYAVYVHERLDVRHAPPTQAKFIEVPMLRYATVMEARLAAGIRELWR
jgi:hypothetical protein